MKPLVCFDMDNTLLKSDKVHIDAFNQAFEEQGLSRVPYEKVAAQLKGQQATQIINTLFPKLSKNTVHKLVNRHDTLVTKSTYKYAKQIPGVTKALKEIKKHFTIAVISNCKKKEIGPILRGANISPKIFSKIIGHDQVHHSKPFPDMIFKAEKLTHHKAICQVGDSILDVKAAKRAKIKSIAVATGHYTAKELKKSNPSLIVKDITKVPTALHKIFLNQKK